MTMDYATGEHYPMQFVEEEGIPSSFHGVEAVIRQHGLFSAIYADRGSHYWFTPGVGSKVDKERPKQFGRAMQQLRIETIAAYSPQARRRSERAFRTHCEHFERTVRPDNCISFEGLLLQIPAQRHRCHFVKARVHRHLDDTQAVFCGPRCLARYNKSICYEQNLALCACVMRERWR